MKRSSLSHPRNKKHDAFSGIEPPGKRRKVEESSRLFDVFINHRGPDVKQTVALQLYKSLVESGIHAFLDSEEKELGDSFPSTIENAIDSSSAHIAIFSKGYAESPWCLAELVLMSQSNAKIFPVFYDVKPSAVRYIESGEYAEAFTRYEEKGRYTKKLKEWKEALHSVSFITGHEISSEFSVSDCQNIVSAVHKEVERRKPLHVAKYPVGLDRVVKDFERRCLDQLVEDFERRCRTNEGGKEKPQIVGIFGMGGVGKTTLAKELFNRKRSQYTKACFLFDVRDAYANKGFHSLQMKLLRDIYQQENFNFHCKEQGTSHIGGCIRRNKQLSFILVVDDIDHLEQLDALLIRDMLNKSANTLVIVTTRDAGVLINAGITVAYNLKGMEMYEAKELFCWHAFSQSSPSSGYDKLVDLFVEVCGGLPLSLQVLGRHVHGEDQRFWELELEKVKKTLPQDIHKKLRVSIDRLDNEEKQIFMDVACFFVGEPKKNAIRVWEESGWSAQHALRRLKNKCLVEEMESHKNGGQICKLRMHNQLRDLRRKEGETSVVMPMRYKLGDLRREVQVGEEMVVLRMHDHLRDLGREMADELSHPRRLWRSQHLQSLESKGFKNILTQPKFRYLHSFMDRSVGCHIKYFIGESHNTLEPSTALLWLELENRNQELTNIPPWIPLQNLGSLLIRDGSLVRLWQNNEQAPLALKELRIYNIFKLEELSLGLLHRLEIVVIHNCGYLKSLTGISDLTKLESLMISDCGELEKLSLIQLSCLKEIKICFCRQLKSVTTSDLTKLVELDILGCAELEELSLVCLSFLEFCIISKLPKLERIEVKGCKKLSSIDGTSWKLVKLNIYDCPKLEKIPIETLHLLERVQILYCSNDTIRNYILNMKKLPSNFIRLIGQAVAGAESSLNANLFCDLNSSNSVIQMGTEATWNHLGRHGVGAIMLCAVVVVSSTAAAVTINDFLRECDINPWLKCEVREGQWIFTSVTSKHDEIDRYFVNKGQCFPFDYLCFPEDAMVKSVTMPVMRGEEHKVLNVLCRIVDNLYQK